MSYECAVFRNGPRPRNGLIARGRRRGFAQGDRRPVLGDYPKALQELHEAVAQGDAKHAERAAHGLKGSVANFGARAAVEAARTIEHMARAEKLADVTPVLEQLKEALEALRPELEKL